MLSKWYRFARGMGWRYIFFRLGYEIRRRSGWLKKSFPVEPPFQSWITLEQWRKGAPAFFFDSRERIAGVRSQDDALKRKAARIFDGEVLFFNGKWESLPHDEWLLNLSTGHRYDATRHWTEIPDFDPVYGDIKYTWEKSRFIFLQTILRYDHHFQTDSSQWVFDRIISWIQHNPINRGPNYRCSQETSLRLFNWIMALYFYRNSSHLTEERFQLILFHIYWQVKHVRNNINFSRIAVRNNHAITETLCLYTAGLLFPFFEEAAEWKMSGKQWFEEEIAYQVYEDGGYLQYSFNYHRVVIQLLTWGIALAARHGEAFDAVVYARAAASLRLLAHCQDIPSGELPNYGANDGSLFFHLNNESFHNYRPALDGLHFLLTGKNLYEYPYEDRMWLGASQPVRTMTPIAVCDGTYAFPHAGIYVYRKKNFMAWINCVAYKNRPLQADNLHLDVWHNGRNILRDGGSYRYNAAPEEVRYFSGTESHNTVMVEHMDQMLKGPRFVWLDWSERKSAGWEQVGEAVTFEGEAYVYRHLGHVLHRRRVTINEKDNVLTVSDRVTGVGNRVIRQLWHVDPGDVDTISFESTGNKMTLEKNYSPTYGLLKKALQIEFSNGEGEITTRLILS